jgi:ABC-type branched-subunit amino acid transport system substrate-binding protein
VPRATTGPIEVGLFYAVNDGAAPAGIHNGNTFSLKQVVHAFVDSYNKTGGIGGRRIEPVYEELHSYNNDYEQQIAAACAAFTQDHHVAVVINNTGYYSEQLLTCLAKASVPIISGDVAGPDHVDARRFPGLVTPITMAGEYRVAAVVGHLAANGWLTHASRVGVVIEDCPVDQRVYRDGLVPARHRQHVAVASTYATQCFQSLQDFGTETSQMSSAVVRFRQQQVDMVMVVSQSAEANLVFAFSEVADSQHWYPRYSLSSVSYPEALAQNAAVSQMTNMRGVGWIPVLDTENLAQAPATAATKACLSRVRTQGVQPQSNADYAYVYEPCDAFALLDSILRQTRGDASYGVVLQRQRSVASAFQAASTVGGGVRLWPDGRLGASTGRLFAFVDGAFRYTTKPFALS